MTKPLPGLVIFCFVTESSYVVQAGLISCQVSCLFSWICSYSCHVFSFKYVEEEADTCGDCLFPVRRASSSIKCFCQLHVFVKENSWKGAVSAETDWLIGAAVLWRVEMLQVQRLTTLSWASPSSTKQPFLARLFMTLTPYGDKIFWTLLAQQTTGCHHPKR